MCYPRAGLADDQIDLANSLRHFGGAFPLWLSPEQIRLLRFHAGAGPFPPPSRILWTKSDTELVQASTGFHRALALDHVPRGAGQLLTEPL